MDALPIELLEMVASGLDDIDIFHLRLVNRRLQRHLLPYFSRRYFRTRYHMLSRHSLENLQQVTSHPAFGRSLRQLIITPHHLSVHHRLSSQILEETQINEEGYKKFWAEQNYLKSSGFYVASLAIALSQARNCKTIGIEDNWDHHPWGLGVLKEHIGVDPASTFESDESLEFLAQIIHVVFSAVIASRTALQGFHFNVGLSSIPPNPSMLRIPTSVVDNTAFPSMLRTLGLLLALPDTDATTWAIDLGRFIMNFDQLYNLELMFYARLEPQYLKGLHEIIHLEKLRVLTISSVEGGEEELAQILTSHKATLKKVYLDTINLSSLESWKWLLEKIRDQLSLEYLELSDCLVDDTYTVNLRGQPAVRDKPIIVVHEGEGEMDYLIKDLIMQSL
ncbi:hypothetical protein PISL3812_08139 [Talaromyces islandicus]|uniref:F-box domain-containing protein n=1 Tax=Talaromyces islandicus TaxID=28573 RepID=A0A0U1M7P8_TALIS|nr:hypothetical protein PISL3812_08139 [Talaromyces islandicus]